MSELDNLARRVATRMQRDGLVDERLSRRYRFRLEVFGALLRTPNPGSMDRVLKCAAEAADALMADDPVAHWNEKHPPAQPSETANGPFVEHRPTLFNPFVRRSTPDPATSFTEFEPPARVDDP